MTAEVPAAFDVGALPTPVCVVGDVHLTPADPDVERRFLAFLEGWSGDGGTLVLLGDIFDYWVGGAQVNDPAVQPILNALRAQAARGVRLAFIPGNRDFLFRGVAGLPLEIWPDLVRTTLGDRTVLLTHGDLLCTADGAYLRMRRKLRSWWFNMIFPRLPNRAIDRLGRALRNKSKQATSIKAPSEMGLDYGAAREWLNTHHATVLIAGHVHTGVHHRLTGSPARDVYVLKDWERGGSAVLFDEGGLRHVFPGP